MCLRTAVSAECHALSRPTALLFEVKVNAVASCRVEVNGRYPAGDIAAGSPNDCNESDALGDVPNDQENRVEQFFAFARAVAIIASVTLAIPMVGPC